MEVSTIQKQRQEIQLLMTELKDRDRELGDMMSSHQQQLLAWEQDRHRVITLDRKCTQYEGLLSLLFHYDCSMVRVPILDPMSCVVRKPAFYICENKGADQLRGNREADQRLCFSYTDSTIPLLSKSEISSF